MAQDGVVVKMENFEQVAAGLRELNKIYKAPRALMAAVRKGAQVLQIYAEQFAPVGVGKAWSEYRGKKYNVNLADSIRVRVIRPELFLTKGDIYSFAYYAYWVEHGHRLVRGGRNQKNRRNSKGVVIGFVGPNPFMRPAYDVGGDQAEREVHEELKKNIARIAKKAGLNYRP